MTQRLSPESTAFLVVDVQERLFAAMDAAKGERLLNRTRAALVGAQALGVRVLLTEQYPKGLGPTHAAVLSAAPNIRAVEKIEFSALVPEIRSALLGIKNVVVLGMETHVCVFQTVRALTEFQFSAHLAVDAVLSRTQVDFETGLSLCRGAGASLTTVEAALFDMLGKAQGPVFKAVSAAVK
jgi:nicotinamidase-related amidase